MTTTSYPHPKDWLIEASVLEDAMKALDAAFDVSMEYHVPYGAGYSKGGGTIYIDSRMPLGFTATKGKKAGQYCNIIQFLVTHEGIEKALEVIPGMIYEFRHQIALRTEKDCVEADGWDWDEYNAFTTKAVDAIEKEGYKDLPPDLDLTPYKDEKDTHEPTMARGEAQSGAANGASAGSPAPSSLAA